MIYFYGETIGFHFFQRKPNDIIIIAPVILSHVFINFKGKLQTMPFNKTVINYFLLLISLFLKMTKAL